MAQIKYNLGNLGTEVYSTNETVIGTWIDGKPLYRKVFVINENIPLTTAPQTKGYTGYFNPDDIYIHRTEAYMRWMGPDPTVEANKGLVTSLPWISADKKYSVDFLVKDTDSKANINYEFCLRTKADTTPTQYINFKYLMIEYTKVAD